MILWADACTGFAPEFSPAADAMSITFTVLFITEAIGMEIDDVPDFLEELRQDTRTPPTRLDWTDRFEGASAYLKRRPLAPATWAQLQENIEAAPYRMPPGTKAVAVTGSLRLAPAFLVGAAFRMVTGADLAVVQRGRLWSSAEPYGTPLAPAVDEHVLDLGPDLAVAMAVATDPAQDVLDFLAEQQIPVSRLLVLRPPGGAKDNSIPDGATANALTVGIRALFRLAACPVIVPYPPDRALRALTLWEVDAAQSGRRA
ncbi:SAVED domain-containing protein [Streptomyces sp. CA-135486]|uniref:SAVED domain-containing protein n=1 Tax=Streptomyces sp. CA-135486 TaxID=3240049 RepID=UPI003D94A2AA